MVQYFSAVSIILRRHWIRAASGAALAAVIVVLLWISFSNVVTGYAADSHVLTIDPGMSFATILDLMSDRNMIEDQYKLRMVARALGLHTGLKAGRYRIAGGLSSYELLKQLTEGDVLVEQVVIIEGLQARQIASILEKRIGVDSTGFVNLVNDTSLARELGLRTSGLEGFLYPETYNLNWGMNARQVIGKMIGEFKKNYHDSLKARADELNLSLSEIATLASIIEGEAVLDSERAAISAVYHNRLKRGMRLQSDPTIQYIIDDGPRRLLNEDLAIDSPYNTYKYAGLPPGPINNPGMASIIAGLYPAETNMLYFVAKGDGSHTFSRTLRQHLKAKAEFDRYRRSIRERKNETNQSAK